MPSTYSQNLRVELIANGEQSGTWGNTTNVNLGTILDSAIAGVANITVSSTSFALTANNGAADQARNMIVQLTGSPGANFDMFVPPTSKFYVIRNATSGDFDVTVKAATAINGTTPTGGTTVTVQNGTTSLIFVDGSSPSNVREALTGFAGNLNVEGDLTVNGNTTLGNDRVSGSYTYVSASVIRVNTGTAHGYTAGQSVGLIVTSVTGGNAKSGYYAITGTPTPTQFDLTYTPANLASDSAGNCLVTNDTITLNGIVFPGVVIEGSSTLPALRITQTNATGAALLIDDTNNPDSTPFLIDASGNVVTGNTAALTTFNNSTLTPRIQEIGITAADAAIGIALFNTTNPTTTSGVIDIAKAANATVGTYTAVGANEQLGLIRFSGADGTNLQPAATIGGFADALFTGTLAPGRLVFSTAPSVTNNTLVERMRINSAGNVIIGSGEGTTSATGGILRAPDETGGSNLTGGTLTIAAGNGTGTSGGSGSILFKTAPANTTGAATDATTLATVMAIAKTGNVGIGSESLTSISFRISKNIANPAGGTAYGIYQDGTIPSATPLITQVIYNNTLANTEAASFNVDSILHYRASQSTFTGGSSVDDQYGYVADSTLVGATDNYGFYAEDTAAVLATKTAYGFYSGVNTATGGGTAYGFYAAGTAANYFNNLLIGDDTALATRNTTGTGNTIIPAQQIIGTTEATSALGIFNYSATTTTEGSLAFSKSLTGTIGTRTQTTNGTDLGGISFNGVGLTGDAAFSTAAFIRSQVDSTTLATGSVPGKLLFGTTNVGAPAPVTRMSLDNRGMLSVGTATASGAALSTTAPAKLFIDNATYTDTATTAGGIVTHGTINAIRAASIASNSAGTNITYTTASTLYIEGAPTNGAKVNAITYPYALYIANGDVYFGGDVTSGSTLTISYEATSVTNTVIFPLEIKATTTGTPAANIGTGISFSTETSANNIETGATIQSIATDVTATPTPSEDFDLSFSTMTNGAAATEKVRIKSTGELQFNSGYGSVATAYGVRAWINFDGNTATNVSGSYTQSGTTVTVSITAHGLSAGQAFYANITSGTPTSGVDGVYTVLALDPVDPLNKFTYTAGTSLNITSGAITLPRRAARAAGNFSTIVGRTGSTGDYLVNFVNPMPDANYAIAYSAQYATDGTTYSNVYANTSRLTAPTAAYIRVATNTGGGTPYDCDIVTVTVFR